MVAKMKSDDSGASTIRAILKPNGEAGDKRKGFVLREAMELSGSSEKYQIYLAIMVSLPNGNSRCHTYLSFPQRSARRNIIRANLDIAVDFRKQDHEKLAQVFKMVSL